MKEKIIPSPEDLWSAIEYLESTGCVLRSRVILGVGFFVLLKPSGAYFFITGSGQFIKLCQLMTVVFLEKVGRLSISDTRKISLFHQNFNLWQKFRSLTRISIFHQNFDLWQKFRSFTNISIFDKHFFLRLFWDLTEVDFYSKNYLLFFGIFVRRLGQLCFDQILRYPILTMQVNIMYHFRFILVTFKKAFLTF